MELEAGQRIGPYQIRSVIGSGGMGTVYLAADTRLHRNVALKFIQPDATADADAIVARLLNEARAASALNHPNVCQVYDVGGEGRESWIAMEYVEGRPLSDMVRSAGLPMPEVTRLGMQIAEGLAHAHSRGVLHRDLKTANIVCDRSGRARILDFGIARRLRGEVSKELSTTAVPVDPGFAGTLAYMAPEVVRGDTPDERSDLWSLGVVLYEMATGTRPFHGTHVVDMAAAIVRDPATPLPDDVPAPFAAIVMRLLAKSPVERYATAGEAAAALQLLSAHPRLERARTAHSRWLMVMMAALVVAVAALGLFIWRRDAGELRIGQQRLLSAADTGQRFPAYSADGSRIAFTAPDATGVEQIWVRHIDSGDSMQLTRERVPANRPRWLSGDRLLYGVAGQGLWVVSALGGTPSRLIERGAHPNVSRDGRRIVFEARAGTGPALWTAAADGSDVRQISGTAPLYYGFPMGPALSPDGSQVAYFHAAAGPNGDFWIIPTAGGPPRQLTSDLREGGWPVWAPDGNAIVFSSTRGGSRTLWQIPATGGEPIPLTTGAGEDDQPEISGNGRQLAYTNVRHAWELKTRTLSTGQDRTLLRRGLETVSPVFSPDGRRITYFGRADEAVAVFTIGMDGTDPRQLTGGRDLNHHPRWGPDGKDIYFFQLQPVVGFRRIPAVGGPSTDVRPWEWQVQNAPFFDPTGQFIAYTRQRPPGAPRTEAEHTVIHEVATARERVWPEPHTHPTGWSPDGDSIVGVQHDPSGGGLVIVTICRVADGTCRSVTRGRGPKWSVADNRIYFMRATKTGEQLWSVAIDGSDERWVADLGTFSTLATYFDLSRDGVVAWAPFQPGRQELWTATLSR